MPNDHQHLVERVIIDVLAENSDLPIQASFYRGVIPPAERGFLGDAIRREYLSTPCCPPEWFVRVLPGAFEVCVSAAGRLLFGVTDTIGEVAVVPLPQTSPGVVDVDAVGGSRFHVELLAAVRAKAAVVAQMRANVSA